MFTVTVQASTIAELRKELKEMGEALGDAPAPEEIPDVEEIFAPEAAPQEAGPETEEALALMRSPAVQAAVDSLMPPDVPEAAPQEIPEEIPDVEEIFAPVPESAPLSQDVERDSRGVPWDARVHSVTKAKIKDGSWRYRRGADGDYIKEVEAEIMGAQSAQPAPAVPTAPPVMSVVPPIFSEAPVPHVAPPAQQPVQQPAPVQPMYENIPVPAHAAKPAHTFETFQKQMIATLAALVSAGAINQDYIETLKRFFGVKEIWEVSKNEAQAREMFENFCLSGLITKVG